MSKSAPFQKRLKEMRDTEVNLLLSIYNEWQKDEVILGRFKDFLGNGGNIECRYKWMTPLMLATREMKEE